MCPLNPQCQREGDGLIHYDLQAISALPCVAARGDRIHEQALNLSNKLFLSITHTTLVGFGGHDHIQCVAAPEIYVALCCCFGEATIQRLEQPLIRVAGAEQEYREHVLVEVRHDEHGDSLAYARSVFGEELRGAGNGVGVRVAKVGEGLADVGWFAAPEVRKRPVLELCGEVLVVILDLGVSGHGGVAGAHFGDCVFEGTDLDVAVGDFALQMLDATLVFLDDFAELTQLRLLFCERGFDALIVVAVAGPVGIFGVALRHDVGLTGRMCSVCEWWVSGLGDLGVLGLRLGLGLGGLVIGGIVLATEEIGAAGFAGRLRAVWVLVNDVLRREFMVNGVLFYGQRFLRAVDGTTVVPRVDEGLGGGLVDLFVAADIVR